MLRVAIFGLGNHKCDYFVNSAFFHLYLYSPIPFIPDVDCVK